jgi:hypothetical protein
MTPLRARDRILRPEAPGIPFLLKIQQSQRCRFRLARVPKALS